MSIELKRLLTLKEHPSLYKYYTAFTGVEGDDRDTSTGDPAQVLLTLRSHQ
jgi:hypothetical protein